MHHAPGGVNINPGHATVLTPRDTVLVIAPVDRLLALEAENQPQAPHRREPAPITVAPPVAPRASSDGPPV
jgi:hypothetical protein